MEIGNALNNTLTRARYYLELGQYDKSSELYKISAAMIDAIKQGENENTSRGKYLIEYSRGLHR